MTEALQRQLTRCLAISLLIQPGPALAQRAEPPRPDREGNFNSSQVMGNRGLYEVRYWLVVDPDPGGSNCRDPRDGMRPIKKLFYGDLLETDSPGRGKLQQAVERYNGLTWLRVRLPNWRIPSSKSHGYSSCLIRAHSRFIAPVNDSDLFELIHNNQRRE